MGNQMKVNHIVSNRQRLVSLVLLLALVPTAAGQTGTCEIEFTYVPPYGSYDDLEGRVVCEYPGYCTNYAVVVYIYVPCYGWVNKPTWDRPRTPIKPDCSWTCDTYICCNDHRATKIIAFLVPKGYWPPILEGAPCIPSELYKYPHTEAIRYEKINFSGYDWWVKRAWCKVGPGPNYFCDSNDVVWVDPNGHLHLKIAQKEGKWCCSEVIADASLGYGTYIFTVQGKVDLLDENIVLGLFTWDDTGNCNVAQYHYREIDIEIARWGDPCEPNNGQYVVQPWNTPGNRHRFNLDEHKAITHMFTWQPDKICFLSYYGDFSPVPPKEDIIECWSYTGSDIPPPGGENPRINFWFVWGNPPMNGQDAEVVIKSFQYLSHVREAAIDIKPQSCPNPLNVKSKGVLPVAILGSEGFDANTVDVASIRLEGIAPIRSSYEDVAGPIADANECECTTDGPDGYLDMTLKFMTQDIVATLGEVNHDDVLELQLDGVLYDETPVEGVDCVVIRGKHKPINPADISKDGTVDMADFALIAENWLRSSIVED